MDACGNLRGLYEAQRAPKDLRAPKGRDGQGHAFMRSAVQAQIAKAVHDIMEEDLLNWPALMKRLKALDWRMSAVPFSAVWLDTPNMSRKGKMATGKDQSGLLYDLLRVHLAPSSKTQITRAMRNYRDHKKENYPISMSDLMAHLSTEVVQRVRPVEVGRITSCTIPNRSRRRLPLQVSWGLPQGGGGRSV